MYETILFVIAVVGVCVGQRIYGWMTRPKPLSLRERSERICAYARRILPDGHRYHITITRIIDVRCKACFGEGCPDCAQAEAHPERER